MAKIEMTIKVSDIEVIRSLIKVLADNIHDLPEPVIKAMEELSNQTGESK